VSSANPKRSPLLALAEVLGVERLLTPDPELLREPLGLELPLAAPLAPDNSPAKPPEEEELFLLLIECCV